MATIADNSDLLILSDDNTQTDDLVIEETSISEDIPSTEDMITFDDISEISSKDEKKWDSLDLSNDLNLGEEKKVTLDEVSDENLDILNEEKETDTDTNFDFGDFWTNLPVNEVETEEKLIDWDKDLWFTSSNVSTMEEILEKAIIDLGIRSDTISTNKTKKEGDISNLKTQIEDLELKVNTANEELSKLDSEKEMITKNTKSLERMKTVNTTTTTVKTETSRKVHNTKRKQAA